MKKTYLPCGKIVGTHGVRGAVKVDSWCDTPTVLASFEQVYLKNGDAYLPHTVTHAFVKGQQVVLTLADISTPEAAALLRGTTLYAHREQIPVTPGAMLQEDLIGLPVFDADTRRPLGTVLRVDPSPAANLLVVCAPEGEVLVPLIPPFVKKLSDSGVFLTPPAGMFREGEAE